MRLLGVFAQCNVVTCYMHAMHLAGIDLNLAVVLHALLEERSVSRAAGRIGLSQSATSHALARLRELVGDPLFVRTPAGLAPTARAEAMAATLAGGLAALEQALLAPPAFDPATARRTFQLGASDYVEHLLLPPLLARLAEVAPGFDVWTRPSPADPTAALAQGSLDLVLVPRTAPERAEGLRSVELWDDHFVGVARRGHPLARPPITVEAFAAARHVFIAPGGRPGGVVDEALARGGRARRIAFTTRNFLVGPEVVARTDLVITLAARIAWAFARTLPLVLFEPPLPLPGFRIAAFWHDRHDADPAHRFLRDEIARVSRALSDAAPPRAASPPPPRSRRPRAPTARGARRTRARPTPARGSAR